MAVTNDRILNLLNDDELEGVLAHELGHVKNRDILTSSIAATLAGAITILARMASWAMLFGGYGGDGRDRERGGGGIGALLMLILAPIAAALIQLWVSRTREYEADATGATYHRESLCAGYRAREARRVFKAHSSAGFVDECAPVYRGSDDRARAIWPGCSPRIRRFQENREAHRAVERLWCSGQDR